MLRICARSGSIWFATTTNRDFCTKLHLYPTANVSFLITVTRVENTTLGKVAASITAVASRGMTVIVYWIM